MRRDRRRFARGAFSNGLGFRLPSMIMALLILGLIYSNARDPAMWQWLASDAAAADGALATTSPAAAQPEEIVPGPTDQDPAEAAEAAELFQVVNDRQPLEQLEMPAYWMLLRWARAQSFQQLQARADAKVSYNQLWEQPDKYRGKPIRLRLHVRQIVEYDAPENSAGIRKLYECWGWTDQSKTFPICTICLELPAGWKIGEQASAREEGVFAGYYLKNMKYGAASDKTRYAPVFLGRMINIGRSGDARTSSAGGGSAWVWLPTIALLLCLGGWVWFRFTRTSTVSTRARAVVNESEVEDWLRQPAADPSAGNPSSNPF
jgi:hypothetical protein